MSVCQWCGSERGRFRIASTITVGLRCFLLLSGLDRRAERGGLRVWL